MVLQEKVQGDAHDIEFQGSKAAVEDGLVRVIERNNKGPWMEDSHELKPCWSTSQSGIFPDFFSQITSVFIFAWVCVNASGVADEAVSSKGYVTFSLTNGPEYHVSQVFFILNLKFQICELNLVFL